MTFDSRHTVPVEAYLTPADVLQRLRVNARTLYRLMSDGSLPAVRIGRQWRVRPSDFEFWLRRQSSEANATFTPGLANGTRGQEDRETDAAFPSLQTGISTPGDIR